MKTRLKKWNESPPTEETYARCSDERCYVDIDLLRMTPSGHFCKRHYLELRACKKEKCNEPAVMNRLCRNHLFPELTEDEHDDILYGRSGTNLGKAQIFAPDVYKTEL